MVGGIFDQLLDWPVLQPNQLHIVKQRRIFHGQRLKLFRILIHKQHESSIFSYISC